jgi:hypothetical protein
LCANFDVNLGLIKECEAPESNSTTAGCWSTRNLLAVTTSPDGISSILIMSMSLTATLIDILLRIRTVPRPMAWLVAIPARHVAGRDTGAVLTRITLWQS